MVAGSINAVFGIKTQIVLGLKIWLQGVSVQYSELKYN